MGTKENSILAFLGLVAEVDAQLRLSQLDLSRATQTYGTLVTGRSVTGKKRLSQEKNVKIRWEYILKV